MIFLTKTWLRSNGDEAKTADLAPSGYAVKSFPRPSCGGGIAVIVRTSLSSHLTAIADLNFTHNTFKLVQTSVTLQRSVLHFVCVYRPPPSHENRLTDSRFLVQLPEFLNSCNSLPGQLCIRGDFNIHYDHPHDPLTANTLDILNMYNLQQTVVQSTHRQGHVLDWVIVKPDEGIHQSVEVSDGLESDYICVLVQFDMSVSCLPPMHCLVRNICGIIAVDLCVWMCQQVFMSVYGCVRRSVCLCMDVSTGIYFCVWMRQQIFMSVHGMCQQLFMDV